MKDIKRIVLTGHRKIPTEYVTDKLTQSLGRLYYKGCETVIVGMAAGTDLIGARIALDIGMEVIACIPHFGHDYKHASQKEYWSILAHPKTTVRWAHEGPWYDGSFFNRNEFMLGLPHDIVLAVMSNPKSGTGHCVRRARKNDKPIYILNPEEKIWSIENGDYS